MSHRTAVRFSPPAAPKRCVLYPHTRAARTLLAADIAAVIWDIVKTFS
jgi:hypothetical protein